MIPILYDASERNFDSNGLGRLRDCVSLRVTEERNGVFECDLEYPVKGQNFDRILHGRTIAVQPADDEEAEPFDIISSTKPINGIVTFHAVHISYRQSKIVASGTGVHTLSDALAMLHNSQPYNPFTYEADRVSDGYLALADGIPHSVKSILGGTEGSILDVYGGEYKYNKFNVSLLTSRGTDRGFTIRYGVNLLDYGDDTNCADCYTACIPYWAGEDSSGAALIIKGGMVESGLPGYNGRTECVPLDLTSKFEAQPTAAQVEELALQYMQSNQVNLPAQTIRVNFAQFKDSEEYAEFAGLYSCKLCDTVRVVFPRYGMDGRLKVVKTVYDALQERYAEVELGTLSKTLSQALRLSK